MALGPLVWALRVLTRVDRAYTPEALGYQGAVMGWREVGVRDSEANWDMAPLATDRVRLAPGMGGEARKEEA